MSERAESGNGLSDVSLLNGGLAEGRHLGLRERERLATIITDEPTPPPFAEVLAPLAQHAARVVRDHVNQFDQPSVDGALGLPIRDLLWQLLRIAGPSLIDTWKQWAEPSGTSVDKRYLAFSASLSEGNFETVLARRPDVAALIAECLSGWVGGLLEAAEHAGGDQAILERLLNVPAGLGPLKNILSIGSDVHNGRQGLLLVFSNGRVIHKPRDLRVDVLVGHLASAAQLQVRVPRMVPRGQWGWAAQIQASPCAEVSGVDQFYRGAGHLLALAQTVGLRDLHAENLVASGSQIVCVDMEVCFVFDDGLGADNRPRLSDTALLPDRSAGDVEDISGLGRQSAIRERPRFKVDWSDGVEPVLREESRILVHAAHIPQTASGAPTPPTATAVEGGYVEGLDAIRSRRNRLTKILQGADNFEIRHVLRPTREYARVLDQVLLNESVNDQATRVRFLSQLFAGTPVPWRPLVRGEIRALTRGQIPRITSTARSRTMSCEGEEAKDLLPSPGLDRALRQLGGIWRCDPREGQREIRMALT